jgi:hypothetical protein
VGSGQFGSQRGAQVLGQINAQAQQCLNSQIANMENQGFAQALQAATAKQGALGQLAGTTANAQQAQNQANLTAGQTAAQAAANQGQLLNTAGQTMGTLAQTGAGMNLACINALSTLGGQQQTIGQNAENFPLTKLASLGSLLQGYSIPVGTKTTLCMSPLSSLAAAGTGAMALYKCIPGFKGVVDKGFTALGDLFKTGPDSTTIDGTGENPYGDQTFEENFPVDNPYGDQTFEENFPGYTPFESCYPSGCAPFESCFPVKDGGLIRAKSGGYIGCASTIHRGALPSRRG